MCRAYSVALVLSLLLGVQNLYSQVITQPIDDGWLFKEAQSNDVWQEAQVPGTVQEDLIRLGQLAHPFIENNEDSITWVEHRDWTYKTTFNVPAAQLSRPHHKLVFHGLDTYATVKLNGRIILESDNMFRTYEVPVAGQLQADNTLEILLHSPIKKGKDFLDKLPYTLPAVNDVGETKVMPVVRKAAFHFGWDWGLRIVTSGIWRPIELISYQDFKIESILIDSKVSSPLKIDDKLITTIKAKVTIADNDQELLYIPSVNGVPQDTMFMAPSGGDIYFKIENPQYWWPNGLGDQVLYTLGLEVINLDRSYSETKTLKTGIRQAELITEKDSLGTSFYFKINDQSVFARGANYIPQRHFTNELASQDYRELLTTAANCNMNMIRVWGGGIYEEDLFYDLCDSLGLMVWQDFMFANTMYPQDAAFIDNVKHEVEDNIRRLHHHPSIVHWCGNNEIDVAWNNWGWQKKFNISEPHQKILEATYDTMFKVEIPQLLREIIPQANYSHTSPLSNWGPEENYDHGSMHYWGVYHGDDRFSGYTQNIGRFNSEYGFQTFPNINVINTYFRPKQYNFDDPLLSHRQKSYRTNAEILKHLKEYYPEPTDLLSLSYLSQLTQAKGISLAIQHHRMDQPRCMGTLYWQLNDCWPAISWSSLEFNRQWKALQYRIKEDYEPVTFFLDTTQTKRDLVILNESPNSAAGDLNISGKDYTGKELDEKTIKINVRAFSQQRIDLKEIQLYPSPILDIKLQTNDTAISKLINLEKETQLKLAPYNLDLKLGRSGNQQYLTVSSDTYIKNLYIYTDTGLQLDKNFIDLLPEKIYTFKIKSTTSLKLKELKMIALNDLMKG